MKKSEPGYWGALRMRDGEIAAGCFKEVKELGKDFIEVSIPESDDLKRCFKKFDVTHIVRCSEKDARLAAGKLLTGSKSDFANVDKWMNGRAKLKVK